MFQLHASDCVLVGRRHVVARCAIICAHSFLKNGPFDSPRCTQLLQQLIGMETLKNIFYTCKEITEQNIKITDGKSQSIQGRGVDAEKQ